MEDEGIVVPAWAFGSTNNYRTELMSKLVRQAMIMSGETVASLYDKNGKLIIKEFLFIENLKQHELGTIDWMMSRN